LKPSFILIFSFFYFEKHLSIVFWAALFITRLSTPPGASYFTFPLALHALDCFLPKQYPQYLDVSGLSDGNPSHLRIGTAATCGVKFK
jgi:hypothetical protein